MRAARTTSTVLWRNTRDEVVMQAVRVGSGGRVGRGFCRFDRLLIAQPPRLQLPGHLGGLLAPTGDEASAELHRVSLLVFEQHRVVVVSGGEQTVRPDPNDARERQSRPARREHPISEAVNSELTIASSPMQSVILKLLNTV